MKQKLSGLYLITDRRLTDKAGLVPAVAEAIQGGVSIVQYRNKHANRERKLWEISDLATLCRPLGIPLIVNDDTDLVIESGADGVHLGSDDGSVEEARKLLGNEAIIGVSCYNSFDSARMAAEQGADYIAFGRFFPSQTKPDAVHATTEVLTQARTELQLPIVAIGGVDSSNGKSLIDAGADMLAVINAVLGATNIQQAAQDIANLFDTK
ncbi:MAG: thiamine phosphate synthase [Gammaproteobacteria bacterium]|uniref:Thiamine-phosphate synthase n=1 Tax=Candidatus Thiopontia autotrophica TaxID=2841688 RepID=A0A8J6NY14_9GAMM|nr:thiamine phosphate synthase [Candidatus Thiopontia autotrophica]MBL6969278.1 thiamine phosphate synthase [Gammaproteobacteria bacterium]